MRIAHSQFGMNEKEAMTMVGPGPSPRVIEDHMDIDRVLYRGITDLVKGEEISGVIDDLQRGTDEGERLRDRSARFYYEMAVERLTEASGRDSVTEQRELEQDVEEGEKLLWAARAESCRSVLEGSMDLDRTER